jgi:glycosyltransferase involved in cell wall biosynthesis
VLFINFNGGPFYSMKYVLRALEPIFFKLANVKIVVMPVGADTQVLTRSKNLYFKHTVGLDYPKFWKNELRNRKNIDRWTRYADWMIAYGECVDYMYHWDSLTFNYLSIDTRRWAPVERKGYEECAKLRILHAPNHPMIKGTDALIAAIELLKNEGLELELILLRGVPNAEIRKAMEDADLIADQFVIGCYGLFAIEAMAMGKPVLCYLRKDLVELFVKANVVAEEEIPFINTDLREIAAKIRWAYCNREELREIGKKGREFVQKHHSTDRVGRLFAEILNELGIRAG